MNEQKIQELLQSLFSLKYNWSSGDSHYTSDVIAKQGQVLVNQVVKGFLAENRDEQLGILQAKVFAYEQIIAKSNFAVMVDKQQYSINMNSNLNEDQLKLIDKK